MTWLIFTCWIMLPLMVAGHPEIPTKGKHARLHDKVALDDADLPRFAEPIANVTVSVGRDALLACVVENLKGFKVAWVRVDTQTILSIHHNVISQNNRISLTYNDHRSWYLHIKEVEESDRGWYMCQVNTDPMRSRKGYLQVVVPPMIVESMTSNDMVVREGQNITLMCKARGYPEPYVMWRREDGEEMLISGEHVNVVDGEVLHITKVSRLHMAAYLCVASNGVPPSISKRVHLRVQFPPMLSIPNQLEGAYIGQDVILECHTEAYPASINYWTTERGDMIISDTSRAGDKYETTSTINGYTKYMKLKIRSVGANDFGTYRCVAKNSLGETDGNIKLDEMPTPTTAIISEMAMLNRTLAGKSRNKNKFDSNVLPDYGVEEWRNGAGNGNTGDNNQTPVRSPPGAFHNSAGALAQYNLLGRIIHGIKMQSLGITRRLTSYLLKCLKKTSAIQANIQNNARQFYKKFKYNNNRHSSNNNYILPIETGGSVVTRKSVLALNNVQHTKQRQEINAKYCYTNNSRRHNNNIITTKPSRSCEHFYHNHNALHMNSPIGSCNNTNNNTININKLYNASTTLLERLSYYCRTPATLICIIIFINAALLFTFALHFFISNLKRKINKRLAKSNHISRVTKIETRNFTSKCQSTAQTAYTNTARATCKLRIRIQVVLLTLLTTCHNLFGNILNVR